MADIILIAEIVAALALTALASWLVAKNNMVALMDLMDKAKVEITAKMDILPPEAQEVAKAVIVSIDDMKAAFADSKVSFAEVIVLAKDAKHIYDDFMKAYGTYLG